MVLGVLFECSLAFQSPKTLEKHSSGTPSQVAENTPRGALRGTLSNLWPNAPRHSCKWPPGSQVKGVILGGQL